MVKFELESTYNTTACDGGLPYAPRSCEFSKSNRSKAQLGRDVIASSNTLASTPDYLTYDSSTSGVLTIAPGKQTCFIRLEVPDDDFPETSESFNLKLTEVREGLASLEGEKAHPKASIQIQDDEPRISFKTDSDVISEGETKTYTAVLSRKMDVPVYFRLGQDDAASTTDSSDYSFNSNTGTPGLYVFSPGETQVDFTVEALKNGDNDNHVNDEVLSLIADDFQAFGLSNYAYGGDSHIDITINQWLKRVTVGSDGGFVPADFAIGDTGRVFLVGNNGSQVVLKDYDRLGTDVTATEIPAGILNGTGSQSLPKVAYHERTVRISVGNSTESQTRREVAVALSVDGALSGQVSKGGQDVGLVLLRRQAANGVYNSQWNYQTGSAGDDLVKSVDLDSSNNVFVAGDTNAAWPGSSFSGGEDAYVIRVNNTDNPDDNALSSPSLAWSREIGSPLQESIKSLLVLGSSAYPLGTTNGSVGTSQGGLDGFFVPVSDQDSELKPVQFGTDQDDDISDAALGSSRFWITGSGIANYEPGDEAGTLKTLPRLNSVNGFLLYLAPSDTFYGVHMFKDADDNATDKLLTVAASGSSAFVGGYSEGSFESGVTAGGKDAVLARVDFNSTVGNEPVVEKWRLQQDDSSDDEVLKLGIYNANKLIALVKTGGVYQLRVYDLNGHELTTP